MLLLPSCRRPLPFCFANTNSIIVSNLNNCHYFVTYWSSRSEFTMRRWRIFFSCDGNGWRCALSDGVWWDGALLRCDGVWSDGACVRFDGNGDAPWLDSMAFGEMAPTLDSTQLRCALIRCHPLHWIWCYGKRNAPWFDAMAFGEMAPSSDSMSMAMRLY